VRLLTRSMPQLPTVTSPLAEVPSRSGLSRVAVAVHYDAVASITAWPRDEELIDLKLVALASPDPRCTASVSDGLHGPAPRECSGRGARAGAILTSLDVHDALRLINCRRGSPVARSPLVEPSTTIDSSRKSSITYDEKRSSYSGTEVVTLERHACYQDRQFRRRHPRRYWRLLG
jgi:hypothetical protein